VIKAKQVFKMYDMHQTNLLRKPRFCPQCGSKYLTANIDDNKSRCLKCERIIFNNPQPAVSILIENNGKFLLGKRGKEAYEGGKWCLPCGYIEMNEDFLTASLREVKEETGLDVEIKSVISVVSNFFIDKQTLVIVLLANPIGDTNKRDTDGEITETKWFSPDDPLPEMAFQSDTHIVKRYFENKLSGSPVDPDYVRLKTPG
jgi:8-oxo-dGTP diphosphatase